MAKKIVIDPAKIRRLKGVNQTNFWSPIGVTQSGGSRYESGRRMPKPVRLLRALFDGQGTIEELRDGSLAKRV